MNVVRPHFAANSTNIILPGNVQAIEETTVNARTSGYLRRRYVDIGSRVRAGEVLADIEAPELDAQVLQARAETSKSQAGTEQAQADVARLSASVAQANAEVLRLQSNLEAARAEVAHAEAKQLEAQSAAAESRSKLVQLQKQQNGHKADFDRAKVRLALAEKTWKRWQALANGGAVSGQELDETEASYESSQSNVAFAQAEIDSGEADIAAARSTVAARDGDVAAAQADVRAAKEKMQAAASAVAYGKSSVIASKAGVIASRATVRAAQAGVHASEANTNRYSAMKGFERITAPFNGVITARNVDTGALINLGSSTSASDPTTTVPHTGLFGIARTDVVRIQVQVPQTFVSSVQTGQPAHVFVQEYPGRVFNGTVFHTSGAMDAGSRTLLVEVRVNNPQNTLIPGMFAQIQLVGSHPRRLARVPANTLVIDARGTRVATVTKANEIQFVNVHVGRDYGNEGRDHVGPGRREQLVTNPTDELKDGETVAVVADQQ